MTGETDSRIAALLRSYGVGETMSVREAARKIGISRETLGRLMRPLGSGETRRIHTNNLDKIAVGLGIPRELIEREMMADWGYGQAVTASSIGEVLAQVRQLSEEELGALQEEIGRMQRHAARERSKARRRADEPGANGEPPAAMNT